jgi:carbon storage regulator
MLVLTRGTGEHVLVGDSIIVKVLAVHGRTVKIGFEAPKDCRILRSECIPFATASDKAGNRVGLVSKA